MFPKGTEAYQGLIALHVLVEQLSEPRLHHQPNVKQLLSCSESNIGFAEDCLCNVQQLTEQLLGATGKGADREAYSVPHGACRADRKAWFSKHRLSV